MKQVIITGCPRSGTRRIQAAFGQAKVVRSRHERDGDITVSCHLAVDADDYGNHEPYWNRRVDEIWHVTRNPLGCIPSMAARVPSGFWVWQSKHTGLHPRMFENRREFAAHFWVAWNQEAERRGPCWQFQIEQLDGEAWPEMWRRLELPVPEMDPRSERYRGLERDEKHERPPRLTWDELKSWGITIHDRVRNLSERYGYGDENE